jgi:phytoene dehydrogenase-like protein
MSGLACAVTLHEAGVPVTVLEASDRVGGRVATDRIEGFALDRGFQVYLPAYPDAAACLDLQSLNLKPFFSGAMIRKNESFSLIADPWRHPIDAVRGLAQDVFTLRDAATIAKLRFLTSGKSSMRAGHGKTTGRYLEEAGFSRTAIDSFFRPFFGGVFLESRLETPAAMFGFVFSMFAKGGAALPSGGMEAIPKQLAERLPAGTLKTGVRVVDLDNRVVTLADGARLAGSAVVLATDADAARTFVATSDAPVWRGATTIYYAAERSPLDKPVLALDGDGDGPINHVCVPSDVAAEYAPAGASLISATALCASTSTDEKLDRGAREQLARWFGPDVRGWRRLASYSIPRALPPGIFDEERAASSVRVRPGLYRCGDYLSTPSINGAVASGRMAASAALRDREGDRLEIARRDAKVAVSATGV